MKIKIFPCQGRCNVSMMTKTVAQFFDDTGVISLLTNLSEINENGHGDDCREEKYIALNGCPAKCATKEFETNKIILDEDIMITKDFDPKNNEKYEVLLNIDEEVNLVQEAIDRIEENSNNK